MYCFIASAFEIGGRSPNPRSNHMKPSTAITTATVFHHSLALVFSAVVITVLVTLAIAFFVLVGSVAAHLHVTAVTATVVAHVLAHVLTHLLLVVVYHNICHSFFAFEGFSSLRY